MKKAFFLLCTTAFLISCGSAANDGSAQTDTSNFPQDTAYANPADTSSHVNIAGGQHNADSATLDTSTSRGGGQDSTN